MNDPYHNPFLATSMQSTSLKRSRSTDSLEQALKRYKPFQQLSSEEEGSTPSPPAQQSDAFYSDRYTLYPQAQCQQLSQQQQRTFPFNSVAHSTLSFQPSNSSSHADTNRILKSISISTKTSFDTAPAAPSIATATETDTPNQAIYHRYQPVNHFLYNIHVQRYGDPETRERWWEQNRQEGEKEEEKADMDMEEDHHHHHHHQHNQQQYHSNEYENTNAILRQAFLMRQQHQRQHILQQ